MAGQFLNEDDNTVSLPPVVPPVNAGSSATGEPKQKSSVPGRFVNEAEVKPSSQGQFLPTVKDDGSLAAEDMHSLMAQGWKPWTQEHFRTLYDAENQAKAQIPFLTKVGQAASGVVSPFLKAGSEIAAVQPDWKTHARAKRILASIPEGIVGAAHGLAGLIGMPVAEDVAAGRVPVPGGSYVRAALQTPEEKYQEWYLNYLAQHPEIEAQPDVTAPVPGTVTPNWMRGGVEPFPQLSQAIGTVASFALPEAAAGGAGRLAATPLLRPLVQAGEIARLTPGIAARAAYEATDLAKQVPIGTVAKAFPKLQAALTPATSGQLGRFISGSGDFLGKLGALPETISKRASSKLLGSDVAEKIAEKIGASELPTALVAGVLGHPVVAGVAAGFKGASKVAPVVSGFGRYMERLAQADPGQFGRLYTLARDQSAPSWMQSLSDHWATKALAATGDVAKDLGTAAAHGAVFGAVVGALPGQDSASNIGGGLGYGAVGGGLYRGRMKESRILQASVESNKALYDAHAAEGIAPEGLKKVGTDAWTWASTMEQVLGGGIKIRFAGEGDVVMPPAVHGQAGMYDPATKTVWVNTDANRPTSDTLLHEIMHPIFEGAINEHPELAAQVNQALVESGQTLDAAKHVYVSALLAESLKGIADPAQRQAAVEAQINTYDTDSQLKSGSPDTWIHSEILAEAGSRSLYGTHPVIDVMSPSLTNIALQYAQTAFEKIGVTFKRSKSETILPGFENVVDSPVLRRAVYRLIKERKNAVPSAEAKEPRGVPLTPQVWGNHPGATLEPRANGTVGNDFVVQKPDGRIVERPNREVKKIVGNRRKEINKLYPVSDTPLPSSDQTPGIATRQTPSGLVERSGTHLGPGFDSLTTVGPKTKANAHAIEQAIADGTSLQGWYQQIGKESGAGDWKASVQKDTGAIEAQHKEFIPIGFLVDKQSNLLVRNYSLTAFDRKAASWAARSGPISLNEFGGDIGKFKETMAQYLKNHAEGLPGDANGVGTAKRDAINAFLVGGNRTFESSNPLRPLLRGADRQGIVRSYRLDRLETLDKGTSTLSQPQYQKQVLNLSPVMRGKGKNLFNEGSGLTSKGWILPNAEFVPLQGELHASFLKSQSDALKKEFGADFSKYPETDANEGPRIPALNKGFVRVNYERNMGTLTIEANAKHWSKATRDSVLSIVADNAAKIDNIKIALLDDKANVKKYDSAQLFQYGDKEKVEHIPFVSEESSGRKFSPDVEKALDEASPEKVLKLSGEQFFEISSNWRNLAMKGKAPTVQDIAEQAAHQKPDRALWEAGYKQAADEARQVHAEIAANPSTMFARQREIFGAAQKAQYFSEGLKALDTPKFSPDLEVVLDPATIKGGAISAPITTYAKASEGEGNPWVRRSENPLNTSAPTNEGRTLLVQFASGFLTKNLGESDYASTYYDKLYSGAREGYARMADFWEIPQWMGFASHFLPDADIYVVRDMVTAKQFLNEAAYGRVAFSALDVNKTHIKELAKDYPGQVSVGGYVDPTFFKDSPNVTWHDSMESMAKAAGVEYKQGVDFRHFQGSDVIPRLTMSSGCKHKCAFCTIEKTIKVTPSSVVKQQAEAIAKLGTKLIYLNDKTFGQAPNYEEISELNKQVKALNPDFKGFVVQTTASQMVKFTPKFLKESGIKFVELGIESYNDPILHAMKKPATEALMDRSVQSLRDNKIALIPNIIIGLPGETTESYTRTLDFLKKNSDIISHANIYNLAVYADTELGKTLTTATPDDFNENVLEKSFHADPKVHQVFAGDMYGMGKDFLSKHHPEGLYSPDTAPSNDVKPIKDMKELWPGLPGVPLPSAQVLAGYAQTITDATLKGGGTTFDLANGAPIGNSKNYGVSIYPERSVVLKPSDVTPARVTQFIQTNADLLRDPDNKVGTWLDRTSGNVYLDITVGVKDLAFAHFIGDTTNQKAIWDNEKGTEIPLVGTGDTVAGLPTEATRLESLRTAWTKRQRELHSEDLINPQTGQYSPALDPEKEHIKIAAVQMRDGKVFTGGVHAMAYAAAEDAGYNFDSATGSDIVDGFLTSKNRFVNRDEAKQLALNAGQISTAKAEEVDRHFGMKRGTTASPNSPLESMEFDMARNYSPDPEKTFDEAKKMFGTTKSIREAGYVLPNGTMLDFSGRHESPNASEDQRTVEHREVYKLPTFRESAAAKGAKTREAMEASTDFRIYENAAAPMDDFLKMGAMRLDASGGHAQLMAAPTTAQLDALKTMGATYGGEIFVDIHDGEREASFKGEARRVVGKIRRFYRGEAFPPMSEHFSPDVQPEMFSKQEVNPQGEKAQNVKDESILYPNRELTPNELTASNLARKELRDRVQVLPDADERIKLRRALNRGFVEVSQSLEKQAKDENFDTGADWYRKDMDAMEDTTKKIFPETKDATRMSVFKALLAALSPSAKPNENYRSGAEAFAQYLKTGKFPYTTPYRVSETGKRRQLGITAEASMGKMNELLKQSGGEKQLIDYLLTKHDVTVYGNKEAYGALDLGPKVGRFLLNLAGHGDEVTVDMWATRTFNRWMGTPFRNQAGRAELPDIPTEQERNVMIDAFTQIGETISKSTGVPMTAMDVQAVLWYLEKDLYAGTSKAGRISFAEAAKAYEAAPLHTGPRQVTTAAGVRVEPKKAQPDLLSKAKKKFPSAFSPDSGYVGTVDSGLGIHAERGKLNEVIHEAKGLQFGTQWRYNSRTKNVYWWELPGTDEAEAVSGWLKAKGHDVKNPRVNLMQSTKTFDAAHGITKEGKLDFPNPPKEPAVSPDLVLSKAQKKFPSAFSPDFGFVGGVDDSMNVAAAAGKLHDITHDSVGIYEESGASFRYNQRTKTLYWWRGVSADKKDAAEIWLKKKGFEVEKHVKIVVGGDAYLAAHRETPEEFARNTAPPAIPKPTIEELLAEEKVLAEKARKNRR